jgi:beta-phosphoglucomutase-like phosphatase (HAD superfamily)
MKHGMDKYKFFFFDFDGVIVDSLDIKTRAFGDLFKKYGEDIADKVTLYHMQNGGVSRYEKFRYYYKELLKQKIDDRIIRDLDRAYSRLVLKKILKAAFISGVTGFIKRLNLREKDCFIVSATPQKEMRKIAKLRKIDLYFRDVMGSPRSKDENLKYLLTKYRMDPKEALYFGDARSDYEAAKHNNVDFIGIVNTKSRELKGLRGISKIRDFNSVKIRG